MAPPLNERVSRRTFFKSAGKWFAGTIFSTLSLHGYAKHVEPNWFDVQRFDFQHPLIPKAFHGFTILQFSDTHLGFHFSLTRFEKVLGMINREKPDLIIFSGDLVDNLLSFPYINECVFMLSSINAPYGKFAVFGNHDHGGWGTEKYRDMMRLSGFHLLQNESVLIKKENSAIAIAGLDDAILGQPDFHTTFSGIDEKLFTILISHAPDLADIAKEYSIHLQLSGHTHGGQVKLPFFGPVILPRMGEKYAEGFYSIHSNFTLYVNRGLGMTSLPYRFLSRPEITCFTLRMSN